MFQTSDVSADEMILLASEQRKKRVEVRLKDLEEREQKLSASVKHKEIKAWLHHGTVRKVACSNALSLDFELKRSDW